MTDKLPPANIEAEEAILGGILLDPGALERVVDLLHPEAFYVRAHRDIYEAALMLHRVGKPTDLMTVIAWLGDRALLEKVGGTIKLTQLLDRTVSAVNIDRLAELVMDKYLRRSVIEAGHEIVDLGYDTASELESVLDQSEQKIYLLSNQRLVSNTEHNSAIAMVAYNQLEENSPIYPTGFYDLDELMVGFEPGTLTLLAGRPSMGKSAISMNFALNMMLQHQLPVAIFSLEMTKKQLEYRLWSAISVMSRYKDLNLMPLRGDRIRKHRAGLEHLTQSEIESIAKILEIAIELPLYINDSRGITVSGIASECRQIKSKEKKLGLVVVDYLQMMAEDSGGNRSYELGDVARSL
jgi:replicative DNA helicase